MQYNYSRADGYHYTSGLISTAEIPNLPNGGTKVSYSVGIKASDLVAMN